MTDEKITAKVRKLYDKLERFYWSERHPTSYVIPHPETGANVGIGLIAMRCPGAFNLAYANVGGKLETLEAHQTAIRSMVTCDRLSQFSIKSQPMSAWLTLLTENEFRLWVKDVKYDTVGSAKSLEEIREMLRVPEIRRL